MISLCFASGFEKWHPTLAEGLHSPPVAPMIHQDATSAWSSRSWRDSPPDDCNSSRIRDSSSRKKLETSLYHRESRLNSKNLIRHTLRHISARARAFLARVRALLSGLRHTLLYDHQVLTSTNKMPGTSVWPSWCSSMPWHRKHGAQWSPQPHNHNHDNSFLFWQENMDFPHLFTKIAYSPDHLSDPNLQSGGWGSS